MTTPNDKHLEPCPFCGGDAQTRDKYRNNETGTDHFGKTIIGQKIICVRCGANVEKTKHALLAWNTRTPPKPHGDEGKALEAFEEVVSIFMDEKSDQSTLYERLGVAFARRIIGDRHSHTIRAALSSPPTASEATGKVDGTPFYPNPESKDQWSCSIPMTDDEWQLLKKSGWRYCWGDMPDKQEDRGSHPYYWFSVTSKHFITSPMAQRGKEGRIVDMIEAQPPAQSWEWIEGLKRTDGTTNGEDDYIFGWNAALDCVKAEAEKRGMK